MTIYNVLCDGYVALVEADSGVEAIHKMVAAMEAGATLERYPHCRDKTMRHAFESEELPTLTISPTTTANRRSWTPRQDRPHKPCSKRDGDHRRRKHDM